MRRCRECRWVKGTFMPFCQKNVKPSYIDQIGEVHEELIGTAWDARAKDGVCGPDGKLWEPKLTLWGRLRSLMPRPPVTPPSRTP